MYVEDGGPRIREGLSPSVCKSLLPCRVSVLVGIVGKTIWVSDASVGLTEGMEPYVLASIHGKVISPHSIAQLYIALGLRTPLGLSFILTKRSVNKQAIDRPG